MDMSMLQMGQDMPGGFFIYKADENEEIVFVNEVVFDIFGCSNEEEFRQLTGNTFRGMVYPEDYESIEESINKQITDNKHRLDFVEYRIKRLDRNIRWVEDYGRLINTEEFGDVYYVIIRDMTELYEAREEKLRIEMELSHEKHRNEAKSAFLFNISHDIRTPMNAIKGFTELAIEHIDDKELLKDYLSKVNESNDQLLQLIDDLLEMSRLDYGRIDIKNEKCNIKDAITQTVDLFEGTIASKKIDIELDLDISDTCVFLDEHRFKRIMGNLISNAVKFTHEGGNIKIGAIQRNISDSGYVRYEFTVEDNGIGMDEEFTHRLYDAFEREETSTKSGYIGTGLGLTIAKRLLDVMGGSISVRSKKGEGTTFTVGLPLKLADEEAVKKYKNENLLCSSVTNNNPDHSYRILLVEDVEINRLLAEHVLKEAGFMIDSVPDGSDAVETVRKSPAWYYDLILMDIQMPVMNGYEAARTIRAMGREDSELIPIVALSANAREEDKRMSMESGMNSHIAKSFDIAHLIGTITDFIKETSGERKD